MDGNLVDALMVLCSLAYNIIGILIFVLRANERNQFEAKLGPVFNTLLIPFSLFWIYNLISGRDSGRLITGAPIIIFLAYDLWYQHSQTRSHITIPNLGPLVSMFMCCYIKQVVLC